MIRQLGFVVAVRDLPTQLGFAYVGDSRGLKVFDHSCSLSARVFHMSATPATIVTLPVANLQVFLQTYIPQPSTCLSLAEVGGPFCRVCKFPDGPQPQADNFSESLRHSMYDLWTLEGVQLDRNLPHGPADLDERSRLTSFPRASFRPSWA